MAAEELRYTVKADGADKAAKDLDTLADKAEKIEGKTIEAKVGVDTSRAESAIKRVDTELADLSDTDKVAVLKIEAKQFQREIERARKDLNDLDGEEARARISVIDNARANLDAIQSKIKEIDGKTVDVKVEADTSGADSKLGGLLTKFAALAGAGIAIDGVQNAGQAAINAQTLATALGATLTETSKLLSASQRVGIEYGDIFDIINQVNGVLAQQPELVRQLGIEADTPLGRFREVYDAVASIEDPLQRNILGAQLFGEEGVRQVAALQGEFGAYVELLDKGTASTEAQVEAAKKLRSAMADVRAEGDKQFGGILEDLNTITPGDASFVSVLGEASTKLTGLNLLAGIARTVFKDAGEEIEQTAEQVGFLSDEMEVAPDGIAKVERGFLHAWHEARNFVDEVNRLTEGSRQVRRALDEQAASADRVARSIEYAQKQTDLYRESVKRLEEAERQLEAAQRSRVEGILAGLDVERQVTDARRELAEATQRWMDENHQMVFAGELGLDPTKESADVEAAFLAEQDALRRVVESSGDLARSWGADERGVTQAMIDEAGRLIGSNPRQADYLNRLIGLLTSTLPPVFNYGGGPNGAPVTINVTGGADPYLSQSSYEDYVRRNGVSGYR